jgi:hypothetical protein
LPVRIIARLLEEQAMRCASQIAQCETPEAERFMRLLAVDLLMAAKLERTQNTGSGEGNVSGE